MSCCTGTIQTSSDETDFDLSLVCLVAYRKGKKGIYIYERSCPIDGRSKEEGSMSMRNKKPCRLTCIL